MDEFNRGMDPAVKRYFKKIVNSFVLGITWLMILAMAGIYFELAVIDGGIKWYNILFYAFFLVSLIWMIRYFQKSWTPEKEENPEK